MDDEIEVWPVLPGEGSEHDEHLFCSDMSCPCHEDSERVGELAGYVQKGLASVGDADRIYRGQTI